MALNTSPIGFEGFEKRLEIIFSEPPVFADPKGLGLRALSRAQIDEILDSARCTIVDSLSNEFLDSYVLSESSFFVYPDKVILKTCGTTKLLLSIPLIVKHAGSLSLTPIFVKYSRGSFIFPGVQPAPHRSFSEEISMLDGHFSPLLKSEAYVIGDPSKPARNWHVYVASAPHIPPQVCTLEMCMTGLDHKQASVFYKSDINSASSMTRDSGIKDILPSFKINDFMFDPCGYSMNAIDEKVVSTIHVTPEDGFSYASFEAVGLDPNRVRLNELVSRVFACFGPTEFTIAVHCGGSSMGSWAELTGSVDGYRCERAIEQDLPGGGFIVYQSFMKVRSSSSIFSPKLVLGSWINEEKTEKEADEYGFESEDGEEGKVMGCKEEEGGHQHGFEEEQRKVLLVV
ncbi:hypothetical protein AMTRI_Chr12g273700 [Amborella trichopoda]|uniref:adenosylmethionine decarboxylase n=1 Tax=Amborella trichopoda TaxID=13333 RepID=W1PB32_AMBTC|nr:S-adenosylmethionine decarboxylase proenzyme [Amborella trichopoda]ERN07117.1 hypothetical protein AMTR_s00019p00109640 [Amborella trichopoda]|eukprot:XP_006845441.2 S-adenosylmethionine decarboxylase proenzyme [Amborella trichopoda]